MYARGAGRAGRNSDALAVHDGLDVFAADHLEGEIRDARQRVFRAHIVVNARNLRNARFKLCAHRAKALSLAFLLGACKLERLCKPDDARCVFSSRAHAALLSAAGQKRRKRRAAPDIEDADALRPAEFMRGKRRKINPGSIQRERDVPARLHAVTVHKRAFCVRCARDPGDRLDRTDLVVRPLDGKKRAFVRRFSACLRRDPPRTVR